MLHILFFILKLAGRILLFLLLLIIALILLIVFTPLRYRLTASMYTEWSYDGHLTWLFGLIHARCWKDDTGQHMQLKLAGFTLYPKEYKKPKKPKKPKESRESRESKEHKGYKVRRGLGDKANILKETAAFQKQSERGINPENSAHTEDTVYIEEREKKTPELLKEISSGTDVRSPAVTPAKEQKAEAAAKTVSTIKTTAPSGTAKKNADEENKGRSDSKKSKKSQRSRIDSLRENTVKFQKKKEEIKAVFQDTAYRQWFKKSKQRIKHLLIRLLPRIDEADIHFGFSDPSITGRVLGGLSLFYPMMSAQVKLMPDFEQQVLEGHIRIHGKVRLAYILAAALPITLNRTFFKLIKQIRAL